MSDANHQDQHVENGQHNGSQDQANPNGQYEEYLAMLEDHRRNCERDGNFIEAQNAKQRIEELKV